MQPRHPELQQALQQLFARQTFGIKLGLGPTRELLETIGSPQHHLRFLHVAGTNGKGSVCSMLASILTESGLKVGLYSSPHLVHFGERMRVNGMSIPDDRLADYALSMMPAIERLDCTFFEGTTAMALRYFADEKVDVVVLETGMGGRLDSTNVVHPLVSVITSIGLDHTRHLGESLEEIAGEKAGIIKKGVPAVVGKVRPRLRDTFVQQAERMEAPLHFVEELCRGLHHRTDMDGTVASFMLEGREIPNLLIELPGLHQVDNCAIVLTALRQIADIFPVSIESIRSGLLNIRKNTGIAGRLEPVSTDPPLLFDVAHNPDGARVLVRSLREMFGEKRPIRFVFGAVRDKDIGEVMSIIAPQASALHAVSADNPRSLPSDEIAYWSSLATIPTFDNGSVASGLEQGLAERQPDEVLVLFGSFFVVGEGEAFIQSQQGKRLLEEFRSDRPGRIGEAGVEQRESKEDVEALDGEDEEQGRSLTDQEENEYRSRKLTVREWDEHEQPRERLVALGPAALSDAELLAILLRTGTPEQDVLQLARELLHVFGDGGNTGDRLVDIAGRSVAELQQVKGIGKTKAITLAAAFELGNRVLSRSFAERPVVNSPQDVARLFIPRMRALRKEQFHVILLNTAGQVIRTEMISEGTLNSSVVHAREVFRSAIVESAASVIGLHNHPSGNPKPSREDIAITKQLIEAGRIVGIPFNDHIIIAGEEFVSLVEKGLV